MVLLELEELQETMVNRVMQDSLDQKDNQVQLVMQVFLEI